MVKQAAPRRALSRSFKHSSRAEPSSPLTPWTSPSPPTVGHDLSDVLEWNPGGVPDHVYLDAASIFQNARLDKAGTRRLVSYGTRSKIPALKVTDEAWQRRAYELAFNTLKCKWVMMYGSISLVRPNRVRHSRGTITVLLWFLILVIIVLLLITKTSFEQEVSVVQCWTFKKSLCTGFLFSLSRVCSFPAVVFVCHHFSSLQLLPRVTVCNFGENPCGPRGGTPASQDMHMRAYACLILPEDAHEMRQNCSWPTWELWYCILPTFSNAGEDTRGLHAATHFRAFAHSCGCRASWFQCQEALLGVCCTVHADIPSMDHSPWFDPVPVASTEVGLIFPPSHNMSVGGLATHLSIHPVHRVISAPKLTIAEARLAALDLWNEPHPECQDLLAGKPIWGKWCSTNASST